MGWMACCSLRLQLAVLVFFDTRLVCDVGWGSGRPGPRCFAPSAHVIKMENFNSKNSINIKAVMKKKNIREDLVAPS